MRKTSVCNIILFVLFSLFLDQDVFPWDNEVTHRDLSKYAADNSSLSKNKENYLKNIGFNLGLDEILIWQGKTWTVTKWLREGADLEDAGNLWQLATGQSRSYNHFHNPIKQYPWMDAGLDDWITLPPYHTTGQSSLLWAQDGANQENFPERDWSWQKVRNYYYLALTSSTDSAKQENFAKTFRGLGHQMHLIQDAAQPDHVRNDAHPLDAMLGELNINIYFESWAKAHINYINSFATNPVFPNVPFSISYSGLAPITQLVDTDQYDGLNASAGINQGIAEYSNANFFSDDTIFAAERYSPDNRHYFPYPKKSSTDLQAYIAQIKPLLLQIAEDGIGDKATWIKKERDGETIDHFVRAGRWSGKIYKTFGEGPLFYSSFYRDEKCHEDYAALLIPRAVGYSAGLLDYFFRGNIAIALPSGGIYSSADDRNVGFTRITLLASNTSTNGDEMTDGSIELVARYRTLQDDPFQPFDLQASNDYTYVVVPEATGKRTIPKGTPVELVFDNGQTAIIPVNAVDVSLQVVYHGTLGNENGAVAVGLKPVSDPTPVERVNNMDKICLNGQWYNAGSAEAIAQVDSNHNGIPEWQVPAPSVMPLRFIHSGAFICGDRQGQYSITLNIR